MNELRQGLPPLPGKMHNLLIDVKGNPVPWFVAWVDGKPDHRIADGAKLRPALKMGLCWLCGQPLGKFKSFCIGPMCCITRTIAEPPSHLECASFAAQACPFLSRPRAKRRDANMPEEAQAPAGEFIRRNPGVTCVWTTKGFSLRPVTRDQILIRIGDPEHAEWYAEGRRATREEVDESVRTGLPILYNQALADDNQNPEFKAVDALAVAVAGMRHWLDSQVWPA